MAPAIPPPSLSSGLRQHISRALLDRKSQLPESPLTSFFAFFLTSALSSSRRALRSALLHGRTAPTPVFLTADSSLYPSSAPLLKRQSQILAIPTTYRGLNDGPAPGALAGIVLGSVFGFILVLYIVLTLFRFRPWSRTFEEDVVVTHRHRSRHSHSHSHSHSRSRSRSRPMTERVRREETVLVEEHHHEPESVIVEEEEDDVVEVIEEHSSVASPPPRKPSGRSGFRTVDPAEFGGGRSARQKLGRR